MPQYLLAKNIRAHGIRSGNRCLLVPMYSPQGKLVNLQRIYRKGDEFKKYFLKDARVVGCYFRMKATEKDDGTICVGTGFATCASINEASGHETYVAFTDANLLAVARMVREDNPDARIVICGDDDWKLVKKLGYNPGMVAAEKAARAVDGYVALPRSALPAKRRTPTSTT